LPKPSDQLLQVSLCLVVNDALRLRMFTASPNPRQTNRCKKQLQS
jgi:hypothetical protein